MDSIAPESNFAGLPRYRIEKQIGAGGGGRVFKAWDEKLQRSVALKRIEKDSQSTGRGAAEEALHLSKLHHPNIVTLFDYEENAEGSFVVMEYVEGEPLGEVVQRGAFPLTEFSLLAQQSLDALSAAHALGLLHRDLKPDNFMMQWLPNNSFQVKLLDFGLAKIVAGPQVATCQYDGTYLGTIHTMPPEVLQKAPVDVRSDLYSLGCVFYYTLTQHMPFTGDTVSDVIVSHLQHQFVPLSQYRPDLPAVIVQWVEQFIALEPGQRFHSAPQALAVFTRLLQQQRGEATPSPVSSAPVILRSKPAISTASKPSRVVPWAAWATGIVALAAAAVWYTGSTNSPSAPEPTTTAVPPLAPVASLPTATSPPPATPDPAVASSPPEPRPPAPATPQVSLPAAVTAAPTAPAAPMPAPDAVILQANDLEGARARLGSEVLLEGTVARLSENKTGTVRYLNMDRNYRNAVALVFFVSNSPEFTPEKLQSYVNQRIRVRGVVEEYKDTLQIKVKALSQIELVP